MNLVIGTLLANGGDSHLNDAEANRLIVSTLQGGGQRGHRIDAESAAGGHLIVQPLAVRGRDDGAQLEVGPEGGPYNALRAGDGGSSRQSLVAITPFDTTQITSALNRSNPKEGDPCHPLAAQAHAPAIAVTGNRTHALTAEGHDASEDGTGRGTPIVSVNWQGGSTQDQVLTSDQISPTLAHASNHHSGHHEPKVMLDATTVRRLTPVEYERLQGFPDNWTATSNGKPQADSPRYQQMGNAVAVPVVEWIARRLVESEAS